MLLESLKVPPFSHPTQKMKTKKTKEWGNVKKHGGYNEIQVEFLPNPFLIYPPEGVQFIFNPRL